MRWKIAYFQQWVTKNRMLLWWAVFLPLLLTILITSWEHLTVPVAVEKAPAGFWPALFQSAPLITLARVVIVALGVVVIMICLFFPALRVGKSGVHWTKEKEEELTRATGEIIGAEVEALVAEETRRWSLVYKWLRLPAMKRLTAVALFRELVAVLGETFPGMKMKISLQIGADEYTVRHPLLPRLVEEEITGKETFGVRLSFNPELSLLFFLESGEPGGLSTLDENFILTLCAVFLREARPEELSLPALEAHFELINNRKSGEVI